MIVQVFDGKEKKEISRNILEALPDWFGIEKAREEYISDSAGQIFFAAREDETAGQTFYAGKESGKVEEKNIGFLCLKETGKSTVELAVMGVLKEYHRRGIGKQLFDAAHNWAKKSGYEFIQVKTVAMGHYEDYDNTNRFYQSLGFKELEVFPTLWDEQNPCQIM